jgi:hypothetical protein
MSSEPNRRFFIRQFLATLGGAAALSSGLTACSTLDEYLFEDRYDLKDQVLIIGGGISGLYLAYKLKQNKTEFRLFEGSNRFGGRIRSNQNYDLGANLFSPKYNLMNGLIKEFSLPVEKIDKQHSFISTGMESMTQQLVERVAGLMPYRHIRLQWKLIAIKKVNHVYELLFDSPRGKTTFVAKNLVLAIPPSQWKSVSGLLELEEMKENEQWMSSLITENRVRATFPLSSAFKLHYKMKAINEWNENSFYARQVFKKTKNQNWTEVDFCLNEANQTIEIEKINDFIKRKMNLNLNFNKFSTENYFDWKNTQLISAAFFKNALPWPNNKKDSFQVIGDFATQAYPYTMEGALNSALLASEKFL